jgi:hypothetical protein
VSATAPFLITFTGGVGLITVFHKICPCPGRLSVGRIGLPGIFPEFDPKGREKIASNP